MDKQQDGVVIDIETQSRMINAAWNEFRKKNKVSISKAADEFLKVVFGWGYVYGMYDLQSINNSASQLDEVLKKQV